MNFQKNAKIAKMLIFAKKTTNIYGNYKYK